MKYLYFSLFVAACAQPSAGRNSTGATTAGTTGATTSGTTGSTTGGGTTAGTTGGGTTAGTTGGGTTAGTTGGGTTGNADMGPTGDMAMMCDVIAQTGCGTNEKCVPSQNGSFCASKGSTSVPTAGLCLMSMSPPSSNDECIAGDGCVTFSNFDMTKQVSLCHQFCLKDSDCTQAAAAGVGPRCNDMLTTGPYKACSISCNPFGAADGTNGCPAGLSCIYGVDGTMPNLYEFTDCSTYGAGDSTTDCTAHGDDDCKPGYLCATISGGANPGTKCHQVCRAGMNGDCTGAGQTCQSQQGLSSPKFGICL